MDEKELWAMDEMERGLTIEEAIRHVLFGGIADSNMPETILRAVIWLLEKNVRDVDDLNSLSLEISQRDPYYEINNRFFKR